MDSFASPSPRPDFAPLGSPSDLRAAPSWREYFLELNGGHRIKPGARRAYFLNAAQFGQFAGSLPAGFEFFAGCHIRWGISTREDLPASHAERLASSLASGGVKIPGVSKRVRAVCSGGFVFFVIEEAVGGEPTLPADWMTSCEVEGDQPQSPRWIGRQRLAFERLARAKRVGAPAPWLGNLDWSRYERRAFGLKLIDSPHLPEVFSGPSQ